MKKVFEKPVFKINSSSKSVFDNKQIWGDYASEYSRQIDDLGWSNSWKTEHCNRGMLVKAILSQKKIKSHLHIEVFLKSIKKH